MRTICDHAAAGSGARFLRLCRAAQFSAALQYRADAADSHRDGARAHRRGASGIFCSRAGASCPAFVKDPQDFPLLINARAETLAQKPSFRAALKRRRCLVIADGFYEWRREAPGAPKATAKAPFLVRRVDRAPMGFAGLMETWSDPSGGEIDTACIITTAANRLMARVHDRMPAILPPEAFAIWLDNDGVDAEIATALLRPAPEPALELIPIGAAVNRAANDDAAVQTPIGEAIRAAPPGKGALRSAMADKSTPLRPTAVLAHADGLARCPWPGRDPLYVAYHDEEWGVPEWDDRALFEKLVLDGFQAGLSWITILRKREAFRAAFDGFEPEKIVRYDAAKVEALMGKRRHRAQPRQDRGDDRARAHRARSCRARRPGAPSLGLRRRTADSRTRAAR